MIQIVKQEYLSKSSQTGKQNPLFNNEFCSSPDALIRNSKNKEDTFIYLKTIKEKARYLRELVIIFYTSRKEKEKFREQNKSDWKTNSELFGDIQKILKFDKEDKFFKKQVYKSLNYKEATALNTINYGKKILNKCEALKELENVDQELLDFIDDKISKINNLPKMKKTPEDMNNYGYGLDLLNDIYIYFDTDIEGIIEKLFIKYFTPNAYFLNSGNTVFALNPEIYLYFCGNSKGDINEYPLYKTFRDEVDETIFTDLISDFSDLINDIELILKEGMPSINQDLYNQFYGAYYAIPKNFLDIISTFDFEGYRLVNKKLKFTDEEDVPLVLTYLKNTLPPGKKGKPSIALEIFGLKKENPSIYGNRTYKDGRLERFSEFIEKYAIKK